MNKTFTVLGVLAVVVLVVVGFWVHGAWQMRKLHDAVNAGVNDTVQRLQAAQGADRSAAQLDEDAAAVGKREADLQAVGPRADRALYEAADLFLIESREILRLRAQVRRARAAAAGANAALEAHMRQSGQRSSAWIDQAVRLRRAAEAAARDQRLAQEALAKLVEDSRNTRRTLAERAPGLAAKLQ